MTQRWLPRNTRERLVLIDTTLAALVPRVTATRERLTDLIPGHSGRPACNGEPGGGNGHGTSIVERTAEAGPDHAELILAELDTHITIIETSVVALVIHAGGRLPHPPEPTTPTRRLAWSRWAIRILTQTRTNHPDHLIDQLWKHTRHLEAIVDLWTTTPHQPDIKRSSDLAADDTGNWCRSHLRIGSRVPRDAHYPSNGVCRWCGDFHAEQGFPPTLELLDAHESGRRITLQMVDQARPTKHPKRRK
jgi:hypothetical protein